MPVDFRQLDNKIYTSVLENFSNLLDNEKNRQLEGQKALLASSVQRRGQDIQSNTAMAQLDQLAKSQKLQRELESEKSQMSARQAYLEESGKQSRHLDQLELDRRKQGFSEQEAAARISLDDRRVDLLESKDERDSTLFEQEQLDRETIRNAGAKYGLGGIKQALIEAGKGEEALKLDKLAAEIDSSILGDAKTEVEIKGAEAKFKAGEQTKQLIDMASSFMFNPDKKAGLRQLRIAAEAYDREHGTGMSEYSDNQLAATVTAMAVAKQKGIQTLMTDPYTRSTVNDFAQGYFGIKPIPYSKQGKEALDAENFDNIDVGAPSVVINTNGTASVNSSTEGSNAPLFTVGNEKAGVVFEDREWE
jgi:hypothetical protein